MGSHSVTCHPTQANTPRRNLASKAGTRFTYPGGMEGWVDLGDLHFSRDSNQQPLDRKSDALTTAPRHCLLTSVLFSNKGIDVNSGQHHKLRYCLVDKYVMSSPFHRHCGTGQTTRVCWLYSAKSRRQVKAVKPKKMIRVEGKVIVTSACNCGTSAVVSRDGEVYLFGKDTLHCDTSTGMCVCVSLCMKYIDYIFF